MIRSAIDRVVGETLAPKPAPVRIPQLDPTRVGVTVTSWGAKLGAVAVEGSGRLLTETEQARCLASLFDRYPPKRAMAVIGDILRIVIEGRAAVSQLVSIESVLKFRVDGLSAWINPSLGHGFTG